MNKLFLLGLIGVVIWIYHEDEKKQASQKKVDKAENVVVVENEDSNRSDAIRLETATKTQKACVNTLGKGVYKNKPLSWKLDACHIPK
tara:strand:+ start:370 stop:633 length:264 start_codon:yes stop_codon:yes gene_type:complete